MLDNKKRKTTYRILKKAAINSFIDIKNGEIFKPDILNIDTIIYELLEAIGAEKNVRSYLNGNISIRDIFKVNDYLMIGKTNYAKLKDFIIDNYDEINKITYKIDEEQDEHIKSNILLGSLMFIVKSLKDKMFVSVDLYCINNILKEELKWQM